MPTEAMALFKGEADFSSTIEAIESLDEFHECSLNGFLGAATALSKNDSGACLWSFAIVLFALNKKFL